MPKVLYGHREIEYSIEHKDGLKSHYVSVDRKNGVVLRGAEIDDAKAAQLILKKARWIINKQNLVASIAPTDIVTGARMAYLGRKYYTQVIVDTSIQKPTVEFNHSKFTFRVPHQDDQQEKLRSVLDEFYRSKAKEKIAPRVGRWSRELRLPYNELKFQLLEKRWGSCTPTNNIIINIECIKLPFSLIDYLIVHELVHTKVKSHSKEFWAELSKHMPKWKELDEQMQGMHF